MPTESTLIELDLTRPVDLAPPAGRRGEIPRGWWVLLVVAACGLLAGSAADAGVRAVARIPAGVGTFALDGDTLFVMRPTAVSAWNVRTGRQRWSRDVTDRTLWYTAMSKGTVELLASAVCVAGTGSGVTEAVDRGTGRELWRRPGIPQDAGGRVVLGTGSWTDKCDGPGGTTPLEDGLSWTAVDPATGAVSWQTSVPAGTVVAIDEQTGAWAALLDDDGGLSTVDLTTGVRSAVVPHVTDGPVQLIARGDTLVLAELTFERPTIDATTPSKLGSGEDGNIPTTVDFYGFDRHTLARRWHTALVADPSGFSPRYCGDSICVDTDRSVALDPGTGAVRWSVPLRGFSTAGRLLLTGPRLNGFVQGTDPGIAIADPRTGRTVTTLPSWHLLGVNVSSHDLVVGEIRPTRTLLARLSGTRPEPIATIPAQVFYCQADASALACLAADQVWLMTWR